MISLVASFQHLEYLELNWTRFQTSQRSRPIPDRRTFNGTFRLTDWKDLSEEFVGLLAEHDLQYREMHVGGGYWLKDTAWNRCLVKCAEHLEKFRIYWLERDGEQSLSIRQD